MTDTNEVNLNGFGLTPRESAVYLLLLKNGPLAVSELSRMSKLHRSSIYDVLERLSDKGFVGTVRKGKSSIFRATAPKHLLHLIEEQKNSIEERYRQAVKMVSTLESLSSREQTAGNVQLYEGWPSVKSVMGGMIDAGREICAFGSETKFQIYMPLFFERWTEERKNEGIMLKVVYSEKIRRLRKKGMPYFEARFLPEIYDSPATTFIYSNNVAIILWEKEFPIAILIESGPLCQSYMSLFNVLWKMGRE